MSEAIVRALGLSIEPCDVVVLITKDGLSDEDLAALDPMIQDISDTLACSMVAFPESVFSDMKVLHLQDLLSLRESIDEAIASKMADDNIPTA